MRCCDGSVDNFFARCVVCDGGNYDLTQLVGGSSKCGGSVLGGPDFAYAA